MAENTENSGFLEFRTPELSNWIMNKGTRMHRSSSKTQSCKLQRNESRDKIIKTRAISEVVSGQARSLPEVSTSPLQDITS
jgi:hypothetical protein